jgi:hypothetical protein
LSRESDILKGIGPAAREAGMVDDPDALKMLDISSVTLAVDGKVIVPPRFFDQARRNKPHLFKPNAQIAGGKYASQMSDADYATARATLVSGGRR